MVKPLLLLFFFIITPLATSLLESVSEEIFVCERTGNDSYPGTRTQPFKTVQRATQDRYKNTKFFINPGRYELSQSLFLRSLSNVSFRGNSKNKPVILQANPIEGRIISLWKSNNVSFFGLSFDGGTALSSYFNNDIYASGGAILVSASSNIHFESCEFVNNIAAAGAGLFIDSSNVTAKDLTFSRNSALIRNDQLFTDLNMLSSGNINVMNARFFNNFPSYNLQLSFGTGAGLVINNGNAFIQSSSFYDNTARDGAGVYSVNSTIIISGCRFQGNKAMEKGSAIFVDKTSLAVINDTAMFQNLCSVDTCRVVQSDLQLTVQNLQVVYFYVLPIISAISLSLFALLAVIAIVIGIIDIIPECTKKKQKSPVKTNPNEEVLGVWRGVAGSKLFLYMLKMSGIWYQTRTKTSFIVVHRIVFVLYWIDTLVAALIFNYRNLPGYFDNFDRLQYVVGFIESVWYYIMPMSIHVLLCFAVKAYYPIFQHHFNMRTTTQEEEELHQQKSSRPCTPTTLKRTAMNELVLELDQQKKKITSFFVGKRLLWYCVVCLVLTVLSATIKTGFDIAQVPTFISASQQWSSFANGYGYFQDQETTTDTTLKFLFIFHNSASYIIAFFLVYLMMLLHILVCDVMFSKITNFFKKVYFSIDLSSFESGRHTVAFLEMKKSNVQLNKKSLIIVIGYLALSMGLAAIVILRFIWQSNPDAFIFFYILVLLFLLFTAALTSKNMQLALEVLDDKLVNHFKPLVESDKHMEQMAKELADFSVYLKDKAFVFKILDVEITLLSVTQYLGLLSGLFATLKALSIALDGYFYIQSPF